MDSVFDSLSKLRWQPAIRSVPHYFSDPTYNGAIAKSVRDHRKTLGWTPDATIISFHGLPKTFINRGDPYQRHCETTAQMLLAALLADANSMPIVYQSSSTRAGWLAPELEETFDRLAMNGARSACAIAPGFAADCVETLEEIRIRAAQRYFGMGGKNFSAVPCLNANDASTQLMLDKIAQNILGWD